MKVKTPDLAALRKVGMIQQKQKDYFAMRLHVVGGDLTTAQMRKVAEVAERFGRGELHLSTRQGVEIQFGDGWSIAFRKYLVSFGDIEVAGLDGEVGSASGARYVADLHAGEL